MSDIVAMCDTSIDIAETEAATRDDVLAALEVVKRMGELYRAFKERVDAAAVVWINKHGPFEDGGRRFWVAKTKTTKCKDVRGTLVAVLEVAGGDFDRVCECLSTGAFKPAATKEMLGERADEFFETKEVDDLKTGESKAPKLQVADTRFLN